MSQDALASDAAGAITVDTGKIRAVISKSSPSILTRLALSEDPTQIIFDAADLPADGRAGPVLNNLPAENVQCELLENGNMHLSKSKIHATSSNIFFSFSFLFVLFIFTIFY